MSIIKLTHSEIQKEEYKILLQFDDFCKKNQLHYFLSDGTLLGAVRHHGFIPWDDDVDVYMLRLDYSKLIDLLKPNPYLNNLAFVCSELKNSPFPFGKLINPNIIIKGIDKKTPNGLWIDIFPLDNYCFSKKTDRKLEFLYHLLSIKTIGEKYPTDSWFRYFLKRAGKILLFPLPKRSICSHIIKLSKNFDNIQTDYVANLVWTYKVFPIDKKSFLNPLYISFENAMLPVPSNFAKILTDEYGDYLTLPPINKRYVHGFDAFIKK